MAKRNSAKQRKKRFFQKLLIVLLLLFFFGCLGLVLYKKAPEQLLEKENVHMEDTEEAKQATEKEKTWYETYYYDQLTETEQRVYEELLSGVLKREETIRLSTSDSEVVERSFWALEMDHSELFWIHNHEAAYQTIYSILDCCIFEMDYGYSEEEIMEVQASMEKTWEEVSQLLSENVSSYEKAQMVYTYLIDHVQYVESEYDQSVAGALWKGECVCAGYTRAAQYLLQRMGVPCIFVSGELVSEKESHSWNIIELDGSYYYMDVTNGDQTKFLEGDAVNLAEHKTIMYDYLCPFPKEYERLFRADEEFDLPVCTETLKNFYVMNLGFFHTYDEQELYDYCCMRLDYGASVIRFKCQNEEDFQKVCMQWSEGDGVQKAAQYYMEKYDLESVVYYIGMLEQFYTIYIMF